MDSILVRQGLEQNLDPTLNGDRLRDRHMGEEKPDEELMGKRKPSPRLSTTFFDVDNTRMYVLREKYT